MEENSKGTYSKTGYLNSDFKIFHLVGEERKNFDLHYHDFYKILFFISGNVSYLVEGKTYLLNPYDIILVNSGELHKPIIHDNSPYERIIIYISHKFFEEYKTDSYDLFHCFTKAIEVQSNLVRIKNHTRTELFSCIKTLSESFYRNEYATPLFQKVLFLECIIWLNRAVRNEEIEYLEATTANKTVSQIIHYINEHISSDLTIDTLANEFYLGRSYLMHLFKAETGHTIGNYITEKRLFIAKKLIQNGASITAACYQCGFKNYSAFYRAFKQKYHMAPKSTANVLS